MPDREPFTIENFVLGMNNAPDAEDLFPNEMLNIRNMVTSKPGQLITVGKETAELKEATAYQPYPGANLFHVMLDKNLAKAEGETEWLLVGDEDSGNIGIVEYLSSADGQAAISSGSFNAAKIACGGGSGFIMSAYVFDGGIRVCDASFGGDPQWFGYIKKTWFAAGSSTALDDYYAEQGGVPSPSDGSFTFAWLDNNDTHTPSASAIKVQLILHNDAAKSNYQWKKKFECAISTVIDGNQESTLITSTNAIDCGDAAATGVADPSRGQFKISVGSNFGANFNKRATHLKVYMREVGTDLWFLQANFNLVYGGSMPHMEIAAAWEASGSHNISYNVDKTDTDQWMEEPSMLYSYNTETGHDPDVKWVDFARTGEGWKTACVVGRTVYLGYCRRYSEFGGPISHGDVLWKSMYNQPDKFIPANMNIAVSDDGDDVVRAIAGNSVVYEFKRKAMRIIDVSTEIEGIGGTFMGNGGIEFADKVIDTPFGPVWINRYGMFTLNEKGLVKLFERPSVDKSMRTTMDLAWWNTNIYDGGDCTLGYDARTRQIIVSNYGSFGSTTNNGIIFDMVSRSWTHIYNRLTHVASNMILDSKGNVVFLMDDATNGEVHVFDFDEASAEDIRIETGETHFKNGSGTYKYLYRVLIKYKHSHATTLTNNVEMMRDGDAATFRLVGTMPQATSWAWAEYVMAGSAVFEKVDTCRLDIGGYNYSAGEVDIDTKLRVAKIIYDKRHLPNYRVS